jgi:hypothetical protein
MYKKIILSLFILTNLVAVDKINLIKSQKKDYIKGIDFVKPSHYYMIQDKESLEYNTKVRDYHSLKMEQSIIKNIIYKFDLLEKSLKNFEEYKQINKIKHNFINKYLVKQSDLLDINDNLNEVLNH